MKKKIQVKQEHIDRGDVGEAETCPIALACNDAGLSTIMVYGKTAEYWAHGGWHDLDLPEDCNTFVEAFDGHHVVKPFEFEVDLPECDVPTCDAHDRN